MIGMEGLFAYQMFVQRQYVMPQAAHYVPDLTLFRTERKSTNYTTFQIQLCSKQNVNGSFCLLSKWIEKDKPAETPDFYQSFDGFYHSSVPEDIVTHRI